MTDDNRGKTFRNFTYDKFEDWLENFDWDNNRHGKVSLQERRQLTVQWAQYAFEQMNTPTQRENTIAVATRTGLRMEVESNFDNLVPVRFPSDFGLSVYSDQHPLHRDAVEYIPPIPLRTPAQATAESFGANAVATAEATGDPGTVTALATADGAVAVARGDTATATASRVRARAVARAAPELRSARCLYFSNYNSFNS